MIMLLNVQVQYKHIRLIRCRIHTILHGVYDEGVEISANASFTHLLAENWGAGS